VDAVDDIVLEPDEAFVPEVVWLDVEELLDGFWEEDDAIAGGKFGVGFFLFLRVRGVGADLEKDGIFGAFDEEADGCAWFLKAGGGNCGGVRDKGFDAGGGGFGDEVLELRNQK
jgi:hypothetical protein